MAWLSLLKAERSHKHKKTVLNCADFDYIKCYKHTALKQEKFRDMDSFNIQNTQTKSKTYYYIMDIDPISFFNEFHNNEIFRTKTLI